MIRFPHSWLALLAPTLCIGALCIGVPGVGAPAAAAPPADDEAPPTVSHPVVEPTAPSAGKTLNAALGRLAKDPRNVDALVEAGNAAMALGDNEAALGFFSRADQVAPTSAAVKTAIAGARLHLDDPVEALRWYGEAEKAGADPATYALDRGLAYDLVGDNAAAVAQYRQVLARSADEATRDEAIRREAVSLAIGGDRRGADQTLLPLLQRQDRAAWRAHVFVLAIAGRGDEAVSVMRATMPADLAGAIGPYLRFMVQLTPAQQAAVTSLGRFPRAAEIGRDDPRVAAYTAAHPRVSLAPPPPTALAAAAPAADGDARSSRGRRRKGHELMVAAAPRAAVPTPVAADIVLPPPPPPPATVAAAAPPGAPAASRTTTPANGGFDLAKVSGTTADTAPPVAAVVPRPTVLSRLDMPPPPRRTQPARAPQATTLPTTPPTTPPPAPVALAMATPATPPPNATTLPPVPAVPVATPPVVPPAADVPPAISHPVVQAVPEPVVAHKPEPVKAPRTKPAAEKPAPEASAPGHDKVASDKAANEKAGHDKPAKGKDARAKSGKEASADTSEETTRTTKGKTVHGKPAKGEDAEAALVPCKPVAAPKGRKGRAAAKETHGRVAKSGTRHGAKGKKAGTDTETCAPATKGERPDGPGGVSRDADSDSDAHTTKGKTKADGKTRGKDKSAGRDGEKSGEKGGKHARYASRIWVEVLTGADRDKMPGEWRALVHKSHKLKGHKPYLTPWRSNFRLLTGPFDSDADAQDFIAELRKDGVSGFEWTSPAGQAVDSLALP